VYGALLDACVLVPNALADTLLRLAEAGFYRPLWSSQILDEVREAVLRVHPDLDPARIAARIDAMTAAFDDAMVSGWGRICAGLDLPDPDDRHVLAAAIAGGAQALVTFNLKDFPDFAMAPSGMEAVHPDEFLLNQLDLNPGLTYRILTEQAEDMQTPPSDLAGVLNRLQRCGVPRFSDAVRLLDPRRRP
jgi:predicted nucleic acid-binding protein